MRETRPPTAAGEGSRGDDPEGRRRPPSLRRRGVRILVGVGIAGALIAVGVAVWFGTLPRRRVDLPISQLELRRGDIDAVEAHVRVLSVDISARYPPRRAEALGRARDYIRRVWQEQGFKVEEQRYPAGGVTVTNLWVLLPGQTPSLPGAVVGAHYDTYGETPGADDNATGVGLLLELSRRLAGRSLPRDLYLVAFVCEEPPYFQTDAMGSLRFARRLRDRGVEPAWMLSLESLGYFQDAPGTQQYPSGLAAFYPNRGNFVGVVANLGSGAFARRLARSLLEHCRLPVETGVLPGGLPGVGWSDHWAFWQVDVPAAMLTDTAMFRNQNYHRAGDRLETLHLGALGELSFVLPDVIVDLLR